jgi:hypothetical protein
MGGPRQADLGPTAYSGRAWVVFLEVFGKARPDKKYLTRAGPGQTFLGPIVGPGRAAIFCVGLFLGPAQPEKMPRYRT